MVTGMVLGFRVVAGLSPLQTKMEPQNETVFERPVVLSGPGFGFHAVARNIANYLASMGKFDEGRSQEKLRDEDAA